MLDGSYWFECYCYDDEHTVRFTLNKGYYEDGTYKSENEFPELYMSTFLSTGGFFTRLWLGIKYVFGYRGKYGYFGNWTLVTEDVNKLEDMIQDYKTAVGEFRLRNKA